MKLAGLARQEFSMSTSKVNGTLSVNDFTNDTCSSRLHSSRASKSHAARRSLLADWLPVTRALIPCQCYIDKWARFKIFIGRSSLDLVEHDRQNSKTRHAVFSFLWRRPDDEKNITLSKLWEEENTLSSLGKIVSWMSESHRAIKCPVFVLGFLVIYQ